MFNIIKKLLCTDSQPEKSSPIVPPKSEPVESFEKNLGFTRSLQTGDNRITKWQYNKIPSGFYNLFFHCPFCETEIACFCPNCESEIAEVCKDDNHSTFGKYFDKTHIRCSVCLMVWELTKIPYRDDWLNTSETSCLNYHRLSWVDEKVNKCPQCKALSKSTHCFDFLPSSITDPMAELALRRKERQEAIENKKRFENERALAEHEERLAEAKSQESVCESHLAKLFSSPETILDSNIWMNLAYEPLFESLIRLLEKNGKSIKLYGPQFDEICAVKKRSAFGSAKSDGARCALKRIERMQLVNILAIEPLTVDAGNGVYADPLIVKLIMTHTSNGKHVCFVSDDVELRIRVRGLAGNSSGNLTLMEGKEFISSAKLLCLAYGLNLGEYDVDAAYSKLTEQDAELNQTDSRNKPIASQRSNRRRRRS